MMDIEASISAVTVYADRARIERRGVCTLEAGTHELKVSDLCALLDPDSLRVTGKGTARVRLLGVDVRHDFYAETPAKGAAELERELQAKLDQDQVLQDDTARLDSQLAMLDGIAEHAGEHLMRGVGLGRATVADGGALLSFVGAEHHKLSSQKRAIAAQRRGLSNEIQVLKRELDRVRGAQPKERYTAVVGIEALSAGDFVLELEYTVRRGASWRPLYDLRLVEGPTAKIELGYFGQVSQSTGEDWSAVALALSTARPAVAADLPELSPWYIDLYEVPVSMKRGARPQPAPAPTPAGAMMDAYMETGSTPETEAAAPPGPVVASVLEANVDTSGAAITFLIPRPADIPADNTPHKVAIALLELEAELDYLAVPKVSTEVYRRARVVNASDLVLLPGPLNLFHGSEFVGRSSLTKIAPQEAFETTVGLDDRVTAERELVVKEVGKQLIGDRRVRRYAYEIEVENLLPHQADVVIKDQLPVAANEDIKVKMEQVEPPCTSESQQGELTWELSLGPQAQQTVRFEFTISAPRSKRLSGLPRD
jgi:uncharacterized protein (TIGR02231 family)